MMKTLGITSVFALCCLLLSLQSQGGIYRWVDENGKVHFSDRPVQDDAQEMAIPEQKPMYQFESDTQQQRQIEQQRRLEMYDERREQKAQQRLEKKKREAQKAKLKRECAFAKDRLRRYQGAAIYVPQEDGSRRYLNEEQREKEIADLKQQIDKNCR
ncbi:MAG: DUF4124 domain-containing protein [Chromatiales bacterium]|nr:DUF4124 domain-containing protein [Chromatiales bacterium]